MWRLLQREQGKLTSLSISPDGQSLAIATGAATEVLHIGHEPQALCCLMSTFIAQVHACSC